MLDAAEIEALAPTYMELNKKKETTKLYRNEAVHKASNQTKPRT